jgi:hypothetical protein
VSSQYVGRYDEDRARPYPRWMQLLDKFPDDDEITGPWDEEWPLVVKLAWLSREALTSATAEERAASPPSPGGASGAVPPDRDSRRA